jgi:opacity protein-like surface antigen
MRKVLIVLAVGLVAALLPAAAASAACPSGWGSVKETSNAHPDSTIVDARAGRHTCFDRFVVVLEGAAPGYNVQYVKKFVPSADGRVVDLRGAATLRITMLGARAHDNAGKATYSPARRSNMVDVSGFRTFRQAYWGGTFEGTTVIGLGVRARLPFRVFSVAGSGGTTRLVIDVAHTW